MKMIFRSDGTTGQEIRQSPQRRDGFVAMADKHIIEGM
jgi:hypothetical protein